MRSKSFETQEVRKLGWKETEESRGIPILWMEIEKMSSRWKESHAIWSSFKRRDGIVVKASPLQSVDQGFVSLVESYQKL